MDRLINFFQSLGRPEYRTCEMAVDFVQDESDIESGHLGAEIYGEDIIGWNKYIYALCAFRDNSIYSEDPGVYSEMIKTANQNSDITIPILFQLKGGKVTDMRMDFLTYSKRVGDERFADLQARNHHVLNIKVYKKK